MWHVRIQSYWKKKKRYAHQVFGNVGNFQLHTQMA